jgi:hypothetical protein
MHNILKPCISKCLLWDCIICVISSAAQDYPLKVVQKYKIMRQYS